jgi:hypothetical protein
MPLRSGKIGAAAVLVLGLASCALSQPPRTTVNVIGDKFSPGLTLEGLPMQRSIGSNGLYWLLRSEVFPKDRTTRHQIYVEWFFPGHGSTKYFAADDTAQSLPVKMILKENCGRNCGQTDTLGIGIDEAMLRKRAATGFQVKLGDTTGAAAILDITPQMINAQLQAEDRILNPPPGMSAQVAAASANARRPDGKPLLGIAPFDLPFGVGVQVNRIDPNTPAEAAGFQVGDLVLSYNGQPVTGADQLRNLIAQTVPGSVVPVAIKRHGNPMSLLVQM